MVLAELAMAAVIITIIGPIESSDFIGNQQPMK
jgi:hypothetical protein